MSPSGNRAVATVLTLISATWVFRQAQAHPNCIGDFSPPDVKANFCSYTDDLWGDGFCCNAAEENAIKADVDASGATGDCKTMYQEVLCTKCHPWSGHLYERLGEDVTMTNKYCETFYNKCKDDLNLPNTYCDYHTGGADDKDKYWSYPLDIDEDFDENGLVKAFPKISEDDVPDQIIDMRMTPDGNYWWLAGMEGEIVEINVKDKTKDPTSTKLVMNMKGNLKIAFEEGLLSIAFSPGFHSTGVFFCSYVTKGPGGNGINRLSRFKYDSTSPEKTLDSEEMVLESSEKYSDVHSAGWIGFKPSSYASTGAGTSHDLYWSMGDSGPQLDTSQKAQNPDELHGSIIRISLNSQMGTDYSIPNGNPYKNGGGRPEICAMGFRNPFRCSFDRKNGNLFCGDVGNYEVEAIKEVKCGQNHAWRQFEGHRCTMEIVDKDEPPYEFDKKCDDAGVRDGYTFPIFSYCHPDYKAEEEPDYLFPMAAKDFCVDVRGQAVIGGFVYRGAKYDDLLGGNYLFADFSLKKLYHLYPDKTTGGWGNTGWNYGTVKPDDFIRVASFAEDNDGELYMLTYKGIVYELPCGDLCSGEDVNPEDGPDPSPVPKPEPEPTPEPTEAPTPEPTEEPTEEPTAAPTTAEPTEEPTAAPTTAEPTAEPTSANAKPSPTTTTAPTAAEPEATPKPTDAPASTPAPTTAEPPATPRPTAAQEEPTPVPTKDDSPVLEKVDLCSLSGSPKVPAMYIGCFEDYPDDGRVLTLSVLESADMTPSLCEAHCREQGADIFAVEYAIQCFCGDSSKSDLQRHTSKKRDEECKFDCAGDDSLKCGGYDRMSAYYIGGGRGDAWDALVPMTGSNPSAEYLGCYEDYDAGRIMTLAEKKGRGYMTPEVCASYCRDKGAGMFGVEYGFECYCGDSTKVKLDTHAPKKEEAECNMKCDGNDSSICGGFDRMSAYALATSEETAGILVPAGATSLGCFADAKDDRVFPDAYHVCDAMTLQMCYYTCKEGGYNAFGLQFGDECRCGEALGDYRRHGDGTCTMPCAGDDSTICGGEDAHNVYSIQY